MCKSLPKVFSFSSHVYVRFGEPLYRVFGPGSGGDGVRKSVSFGVPREDGGSEFSTFLSTVEYRLLEISIMCPRKNVTPVKNSS